MIFRNDNLRENTRLDFKHTHQSRNVPISARISIGINNGQCFDDSWLTLLILIQDKPPICVTRYSEEKTMEEKCLEAVKFTRY